MKKIRLTYTHYASVINYLFFGGLTTLINIGVFTMFNQFTSLNYQLANIIAWFLSVLFAYITNKLWVFSSKTNTRTALAREIASFFLFRGLSLLLDILIMWIGISLLNYNPLIVKIIDNIIIVAANYVFSKLFIFKSTKPIATK
ncbi:membrane protein [Paucilactobacillus hokkaidonensis JCM 18461]|uniref:Membrane protein n=2 Tax=Paucilactobacillus hokkaidonensis TaxID=1193095 RepID=A0A0A1GZ58_9LACO|nr:GtrA family protein [Paucilactobacillus hokkaidonensis]KRO10274.1 GtcA family membrane protein [Paucilactobacillus hokkaidonensis]BAP86293.1 membrane protein [Paucilactobacillus hokkaidonensis JCM 18461]